MALIQIDTDICREEATGTIQSVGQQVDEIRNALVLCFQNVGADSLGAWFDAYSNDMNQINAMLAKMEALVAELQKDIVDTANGYDEGNTTTAGFFGIAAERGITTDV
jgi:uncharacterized protein YukE